MADFFERFSAGVRGFVGGFRSPGKPMGAALPKGTPPAAWDYPYGYNYSTAPRSDENVGFEDLRALADNYDLLRLAIEKRKNQIEALDWNIVPTNKRDPVAQQISNEVYQFFRRPDRLLSFGRWQRALVEDVLVIDAPAIYVRRNLKGGIYGFELIDGATIKKNIDETGRTPLPPYAAYQQVIEGLPSVDLTTEELLYFPRNVRSHKVYGYSNVEQIILTVNIALRRQLSQLGCYTEGNIPEAFISCPTDWGLEQIEAFQGYWDSLFMQKKNMRRQARFVPNGTTPTFYKESPLKDQFDEWLARIISYCLDLPPTALVKETNRATAETTQDAGKAEGMASMMKYLKEIYDILIQYYMGFQGVEFKFMEEDAQKPIEQAQVNEIYIRSGVLTQDEVREDLGRDPLTDDQRAALEKAKNSAVNPYMLNGVLTTDEIRAKLGQEPLTPEQRAEIERDRVINPRKGFELLQNQNSEKITKTDNPKRMKELPPLFLDETEKARMENKLSEALLSGFAKLRPGLAAQLEKSYEKHTAALEKLDSETKDKVVTMILDELEFDGWAILFDDAAACLAEVAKKSGAQALAQVGVTDKDITKFVDKDAIAWAKERAAEMVGMRWDGRLIQNPNPVWAITDGTRDYLRETVTKAVEEGWSPQKLKKEILEDEAMWEYRAKMIAETELNMAHAEGNLIGWRESGVVEGKRSLCQRDRNYPTTDPCPGNADAGVIGLEETFPSGRKTAPFHPNCKCVVIAVVNED